MPSSVSIYNSFLLFAFYFGLDTSFAFDTSSAFDTRYNSSFTLCGCHEIQENGEGLIPVEGAEILGSIDLISFDDSIQQCSTFCKSVIGITHATVIGQTCHCYANLNPFHCEEEEGALLANVYCITKEIIVEEDKPVDQPEQETEPSLSWRGRLQVPLLGNFDHRPVVMSSLMNNRLEDSTSSTTLSDWNTTVSDDDSVSSSTLTVETSIILVVVLVVSALVLLIGMCAKTWFDVRKQRKLEQKQKIQETKDAIFTTIAIE